MRLTNSILGLALSTLTLLACGPAARHGGDDDGGPDAATPVTGPEICNDAIDNDGDGRIDCSDPDCSGIGDCPICGSVENPEATPLALPDGVSSGTACSTDAQCTLPATPNCVAKECHGSYVSTLNFIGFPANSTLTDPNKLLEVCVTMEHSWLRDLQMELIAPNGAVFILDKFVDRAGGEIYLGDANDSDSDANPVPGVGMQYCWNPTAANVMVESASVTAPTVQWMGHDQMPAGNYKSVAPWSALTGVPLNGMWSMRVTDLWGIDNGYMFKWSIKFDPTLVSDCAGPIIL